MKMKYFVTNLLSAGLIGMSAIQAQPVECQRCDDADRLVTTIMSAPHVFDLSTNEHLGRILGDRLAIAITKRLSMRDLRDPDKADRVLLLLRYAFSDPSMIPTSDDKKPGVTLLLLDILAEQSSDARTRRDAQELAEKLRGLQ